jgi:hypothetical protein
MFYPMTCYGNSLKRNSDCDEEFTSVPEFIYRMDRSGQRGIGKVRANFRCWATKPACHSSQAAHAPKQVDNLCRFSPAFRL